MFSSCKTLTTLGDWFPQMYAEHRHFVCRCSSSTAFSQKSMAADRQYSSPLRSATMTSGRNFHEWNFRFGYGEIASLRLEDRTPVYVGAAHDFQTAESAYSPAAK
jgi:hypothetical protein